MKRPLIVIALLLFALPLLGLETHAHAMTAPGTEIKNWASVTYSVGSVTYPPKVSNETAFTVLELIEVKATWEDAANIEVEPGAIKAVTTFRVTSTGNGVETFALTVNTSLATDDFNPALVSIYLDTDNDGLFDLSKDTLYLSGVNDPVLLSLGSVTVFVLCDIPPGLSTDRVGKVELTATSRSGFGDKGEILPNLGDGGVDAMLGFSGGQATATGAYETNVTDYLLTLTKEGSGSVTSDTATIACDIDCTTPQQASFPPESKVILTATPAAGQVFVGWTGACTGADLTCEITMSAAQTVKATFVPTNYPIGNITINNGAATTTVPEVTLNLSATDTEGIVDWFVSESSTAPTAVDPGWQPIPLNPNFAKDVPFTLSPGNGDKTVYAWYRDADGHVSVIASDTIKFDSTLPPDSDKLLTLTKSGEGNVASAPGTITCGTGCSTQNELFPLDTTATLTATPATGYIFSGWTGDCSGTATTCTVVMSENRAVTATFVSLTAPEISSEIVTHQSTSFAYPVGANIPDVDLRHIPGSYHQVIIRSANKRTDSLDNVALVLPIAIGPKFCIDTAKTGVERYMILVDVTPSSGLSLANVTFSNDAGASYTYTPILDSEQCDAAITHVKAQLSGSFNASDGTNHPYFELSFIGYTAVGTMPGTEIRYSAGMSYTVSGQGGSLTTAATAIVAELLNVVTIWQDSQPVVGAPGGQNVVTTFKVTNLGNGSEPFALNVVSNLSGDDFDPTLAAIWFDSDNDGLFDATKDTRYISGSNEPVIAANASLLVFVLCNIPTPADLGADYLGNVQLTATAKTSGAGTAGTVIPALGDGGVDAVIANTGATSAAIGIYKVSGATVKILKSVTIVSDTIGSIPPLPLTGSVLRYTLAVTVEGNGSAQSVVVTDLIPANTHYLPGSLTLNNVALSDVADADAGAASTVAVVVNVGTVSIGDKRLVSFAVTID